MSVLSYPAAERVEFTIDISVNEMAMILFYATSIHMVTVKGGRLEHMFMFIVADCICCFWIKHWQNND